MVNELKQPSKTTKTGVKVIFEALKVLKEHNGELPGKVVIDKLRERLDFNEWETSIYEKTGYVRWESLLHFFTIDCVKAGYLRKNKGIWYLTKEGEKALKLGPEKLFETARMLYRKWKAKKDKEVANNQNDSEDDIDSNDSTQLQRAKLDKIEEQAIEGIKEYIYQMNPYDFQDLVAALLRAMDYHTPFVSPKGRDGGIDIIAYRDPLGATDPRIKVQVKHRPNSTIPVSDIRGLLGLLNKSGEIGLFVTSGTFTNESLKSSRESHIHVKLIDIDDFIQLWKEFYNNLTDEDKNKMPLHQICFLGVNE